MKKFLTTIAKFGAVLLFLCVIIEIALLHRPNIYAYKYHYIEDHLNDIRILLLGSSHIEEGVMPELLGDDAFNLAISARLNEYDAALAEKYVPQMDSLKVVVMHIDYSTFMYGRLKHNPKETNSAVSLIGTCHCMHTKYMKLHVAPFWYWSEILNSKLNYMSRFWNGPEVLQECDSLGFVRLNLEERRPGWEYRNLADEFDPTAPVNQDIYNRLWTIYDTIARVTSQKGVRLILINTPVYKTFQEAVNENVLNDIQAFINKLQDQYHNVEYHNYMFADNFVPDDFNDSSHLTASGAEKLSKMLADAINHPSPLVGNLSE